MNIGQWQNGGFHTVWGIYDKDSYDEYDRVADLGGYTSESEYLDAYDAVELDLWAPDGTPEGWVEVRYDKVSGAKGWVEVREGRFVPMSTDLGVLRAVCENDGVDYGLALSRNEYAHHVYIEKFIWNEDEQVLVVWMGS